MIILRQEEKSKGTLPLRLSPQATTAETESVMESSALCTSGWTWLSVDARTVD